MAHIQLTEEYNSIGGVGGSCALCNASKRITDRPERILTTDLVTNMVNAPPGVWPEQWLEFCETCVNEMGRLVGMITETEKQDLVFSLTRLEEENTRLLGENEELQKKVDVLAKAFETLSQKDVKK